VHGASAVLIVMIGLMIVGMITPTDLPKHFAETFKQKPSFWMIVLVAGILVGVAVAVSSGLLTIYFPEVGGVGFPGLSQEIIVTLGVIVALIIPVLLLVALG